MVDYTIKGIREEDFMTLRWNADIHIIGEKMGPRYRIRNNKGTLLGEMIQGTKDEQYKIIFYGDVVRDNFQDIERIAKVAGQLAKKHLQNPVIEKRIFSPHQINYLKYAA
jgi:hypothetical protein